MTVSLKVVGLCALGCFGGHRAEGGVPFATREMLQTCCSCPAAGGCLPAERWPQEGQPALPNSWLPPTLVREATYCGYQHFGPLVWWRGKKRKDYESFCIRAFLQNKLFCSSKRSLGRCLHSSMTVDKTVGCIYCFWWKLMVNGRDLVQLKGHPQKSGERDLRSTIAFKSELNERWAVGDNSGLESTLVLV